VARLAFGVRPTSVPLLALAVVSVAIGIIGVMMVFSVLGKSEAAVSGISWAVIVVMAMLGGGMLPLAFMPAWMVPLSNASIVKWSILALEGGIWRDFTVGEMLVPCGVLLLVGVIGFGIGSAVFRVGERD
jgi:ABC-2 type transport system permease protein